jgi:hypothetical protein
MKKKQNDISHNDKDWLYFDAVEIVYFTKLMPM